MRVFRLGSFPIEQEPDIDRLEHRLSEWFLGNDYPTRLLAYSRGFQLEGLIRGLRRELGPLGGGSWRVPLIKEQAAFYATLQQGFIRSAEYLLLTWEPPTLSGASIAATLSSACGRPACEVDALPAAICAPYIEEPRRLRPEVAGQPWLAALIGYDARSAWDATLLHELMALPFDIAIAVDIETLSRRRGMAIAEGAYNTARVQIGAGAVKDVRAERVIDDAERAMHELADKRLHRAQVAVLVSGASAAELDVNIVQVRECLGSRLLLTLPAGAQAELLKLWSTTPSARIEMPRKPRTVLTDGLGCLMGVIGYHRPAATDGLLWGIDAQRRAPVFADLFGGNQAAHMVVLGKTGYGKTFFLNVMTLRAAALAGHKVIAIDSERNAARIGAAAGDGAQISWVGLGAAINILDRVFSALDGPDWLARQTQHVIGQLALLLGTPGVGADGKRRYIPIELSVAQRGVLDLALSELYRAHAAPLLPELIAALEALGEAEADDLARTLRFLIYGAARRDRQALTTLGAAFARPTQIDWSFAAPINCFDFSEVPEQLRPLYYAQAVGAVHRFMRDAQRDRGQRTLLIIDEFGLAAQVEAVARLAADVCKVARKYGIGLMVVDQNPSTFLASQTGREIFENAAAKVLFHLDDLPAREIGAAIGDLTPPHVAFLSDAQPGQCVGVFGNDVYVMHIEANRYELRRLVGS